MGGILYVWDRDGLAERRERCLDALRRLRHRGPDGQAHRDDPQQFLGARCRGAASWWASDDGAVTVALDGRLHDPARLAAAVRQRGVKGDLASDAALLGAAYVVFGERFVTRLDGVWAFALWDAPRRTVLLGRDPLGTRPLYLCAAPHRILAASEAKAILVLEPDAAALDRPRLRALIHRGEIDDWAATCFARIRPVAPGTVVRLREGEITVERSSTLRTATNGTVTAAEIGERLVQAVVRHTPAGTPIGLALSGGIDSSSLAGILAGLPGPHRRDVRAFSVTPPHTTDESALIDATVRHTGLPHAYVPVDGLDHAAAVDRLLACHDEPVHYSGALYQFVLRERMAAAGCRAALVGYGADEIFAGYREFAWPFLAALATGGRLADAARFVRGAGPFLEMSRARIVRHAWRELRDRARASAIDALKRAPGIAAYRGRRASSADPAAPLDSAHGSYPEPLPHGFDLAGVEAGRPFLDALMRGFRRNIGLLVRQEDRNAAAHGLELCAPFLDLDLVESALSLPYHRYLEGGRNKAVLRDATWNLLAPEVRTEPRKLLTPGNDAHVAFDLLGADLPETLSSSAALDPTLWSPGWLEAYRADAARRAHGHVWFRMFVVARWHVSLAARTSAVASCGT